MIFGLCGHKGVGKSTLARLMDERYDYRRIPFAGGLKAMFYALYEYQGLRGADIRRRIEGNMKEKPTPFLSGRSTRWGMQTLGTEWGRDLIHPDLWVNVWWNRVQGQENVVADDLRFPNEAKMVKSLGGKVIRIMRVGKDSADEHRSEVGIEDGLVDWGILNYDTPKEMLSQWEKLMCL